MQHLHEESIEDSDIPDSTVVESFWLSKDAEFDWFDQNAFLERKESTKGSFNSTVHSNSSSQRYSETLKPKAHIIGLPKTHKTTYVDIKCRQYKPLNVRLFPKQLYSVGKAPPTEPSSPNVSCIGRVRSKRCRKSAEQPVVSGSQRSQKAGLRSRIMSLFRSKGHREKDSESPSEKVKKPGERSGSRRKCVSVKPVNSEPGTPSEPPALGGMIRFTSRRSDYLVASENDDMAGCHSLDLEMRV
ncbi:putative calcium/calmodulin-dependent protein kinase [Helianthus annuus]|uniref:Calcium/calmodulin-dependent protein kinase n=1 Tax=Helianthus annuus TaxID=4232 RepID=A0A251UY16_HELAN|nr:uncharacterized protein LOC110934731 [Helianthus annuus]KAF5809762.1 putative calcium/calmodulin-dependent protein kinase [Helianthus annuus]KAJ0580731.1 putative calcium/calmodulin-dependent protein kinase [Helianthus annuus]KAJ0588403.1 putative calcium/calmodulin-dependent protein kinase [Helianthus annuus]KAJ0757347.1 putative calcium/calmodulin-dependent protein kinase [Helianthus annuus]KAJ0761054.1 putative calcium/calmodulin-dependent protein kinase [Helianthus annuus]